MRRGFAIAAAVVSSAVLVGVAAGCGSGESAAVTPADATTIENVAAQTDSEGKTVSAPGGSGETPSEAAPPDGGGEEGGAVAAGKAVFEANCQACHPAGGTEAGAGPQLSATAMDGAAITKQVRDGGGAMPGGLVTGADLEAVVAYVESIRN